VTLEATDGGGAWTVLATGVTNADGRVVGLLAPADPRWGAGVYRLTFDTSVYHRTSGQPGEPFFPEVTIVFRVTEPETHYHVPLLLSPFGYSTYRGS
jgi:5-hydroxyisourate hydrolase